MNSPLKQLSSPEMHVAQLMAEGYENAQIAAHAGLSENTVKMYLSRAYHKTGTYNRVQLARLIWENARQQPTADSVCA